MKICEYETTNYFPPWQTASNRTGKNVQMLLEIAVTNL